MMTVNFPGEYVAKWGLTDLYEDAESILRGVIDSKAPFETGWIGCRKEIRYMNIQRDEDGIHIFVSAHMDDLTDSNDLIYDALWEVMHEEIDLDDDIIDEIRECADFWGVTDQTVTESHLDSDASFDEVLLEIADLESEAETDNERMFKLLCRIVKEVLEEKDIEVE